MEKKLIITYAVLAYLKETSDSSKTSIFDIYIPLIKKGLSDYSEEHGITQIMGRSFSEIQEKIFRAFGISIPIPVLSHALKTIERQINDDNIFKINRDNSFIIKSYIFSDIDDIISTEKEGVQLLEDDFYKFCKNNNCTIDFGELINFIKAQEIDLFTNTKSNFQDANSLLPKYLDTIIQERSNVYQIVCNLYLGSLLASYFELNLQKVSNNVKLLIDTNFFISLIDLNTEDAFSVCNQVFQLCKQLGYQFYILESTIRQIEILLNNRIQDFGSKDFIGTIRSADVFNACIRRNIQKTELEAIRDSVRRRLKDFGVETILDVQIRDLIDKAKKQEDFKQLKERRGNNVDSALNDIVARLYVEKNRGNNISDFSDVQCWFLHNSYSPYEYSSNQRISDRWSIGANELLVLLWLANPAQGNIKTEVIANSGIASYITKYRRAKTPSTKVLKGIKQKIDNAVSLGIVDEKTIYNLTIRMSEGSIDQETTNALVELQDDKFVLKLNEFKDADREKDDKIEALKKNLDSLRMEKGNQERLVKQQETLISELNNTVEDLKKYKYAKEQSEYVAKGMRRCRRYTIGYVVFVIFIIFLWLVNQKHVVVEDPYSTIISLAFFIASTLGLRFVNHTTIEEFFNRKRLKSRLIEEFEKKNK